MDILFRDGIDVELINHMGSDNMVVYAARVSTQGSEVLDSIKPDGDSDEYYGLINYLMKHRHGTPFEHGAMTFYVRAPIFVWREWHRHRIGFSYNEESGRYSTLKPEFYLPPDGRPMFKVEKWKPGRPKFLKIGQTDDPENSVNRTEKLRNNLRVSYATSYENYLDNLEMGFDPGLARDGLPVGIYSSCWVTCNPRSMMAFLSLRTHEPTATSVSYPLYEIEVAARKCEAHFKEHWPLTHKAFCENGRVGP